MSLLQTYINQVAIAAVVVVNMVVVEKSTVDGEDAGADGTINGATDGGTNVIEPT